MRKSKLGAFTKISGFDGSDDDGKENKNYDEKEVVPNKRITRSKTDLTRVNEKDKKPTSTNRAVTSNANKTDKTLTKTNNDDTNTRARANDKVTSNEATFNKTSYSPANLYHKNGRMKSCAYESTDSDFDLDSDFDSADWDCNDDYIRDCNLNFFSDNDSDFDDYYNSHSEEESESSILNYLNNLHRVSNDPIIHARIRDFNRFMETRSANQTRSDFQNFVQELAQYTTIDIIPFSGFNASDYNRNSGLTESEISRLPRHFYRGQTQKEKRLNESRHKCCICMAELELNEELILLEKCSHRFHAQCLESWLNRSVQCPICRCAINPPPLIIN